MKPRATLPALSLRAFAIVLAGLIGAIATFGASAQIRPAYTKNVDEPGRIPYNFNVEFTQFGCSFNCFNFISFGNVRLFDAPPVPAGKRLVVLHVSAELPSNDQFNSVSFQVTPILSNQRAKWQYHGPFYPTGSPGVLWGMTSEAFFTYEAGENPHIRVRMGTVNNFFASVTVSGYLIDASN